MPRPQRICAPAPPPLWRRRAAPAVSVRGRRL